jgi:hypothetical protein
MTCSYGRSKGKQPGLILGKQHSHVRHHGAGLRWSWRGGPRSAAGSLGVVRLTVFWNRMNSQFGEKYAASVAQDYVLDSLGGRTVNQALADGVEVKAVWQAVCEAFDVPENLR